MLGDIQVLGNGAFGYAGDEEYQVNSGTTASIAAGEPVAKALGQRYAALATTGTPIVATDYYAGFASSASTETATAKGTVHVTKLVPGVIYIGAVDDTTLITTQALYDAYVGKRTIFTVTSLKFLIDLTDADNADGGLVVEPLDVKKYPGKVAFSVRRAVSYLA